MALQLRWLERNAYESLERIPGARPVNPSKCRKFWREIRKNNGKLPETKPWILIINAKNQIIDGQNRLQAVLEHNRRHPKQAIEKIPYVLEADAGLDRSKELNQGKDRWKDDDYIASWKDLGYADFAELQEILTLDSAKKLSHGTIYAICADPMEKNLHGKIVNGTFKMWRDREDVEMIMEQLAGVKSILVNAYGPAGIVIPIFIKCTRICGIDMKRLCSQLKRPDDKVQYSNREDVILAHFTRLYNKRLSAGDSRKIDIFDQYRLVAAYNTIQEYQAIKQPTKKAEVKALRPTRGTIKHSSLHDNGVVPV